MNTSDALLDLIPSVHFKKGEKHRTSLMVSLPHGFLSRFLNRTNDAKSRKASDYFEEGLFQAIIKLSEASQRSMKTKVYVNFLSSSGIETGKFK